MDNISWDISVPIFRNRIIMKQLGMAIGIPFGLLLIIMLLMKAYYGVILVAALLVLTLMLVILVFRGKYDIHIEISDYGIRYRNQNPQAGRVRKMSAITVILGIFTKSPTAAGAALLSGGRTEMSLRWADISKLKYIDRQRTIIIRGRFLENMALFCLDDNYETVKEIIEAKYSK